MATQSRKRIIIAEDYEPFAVVCRHVLELHFDVVAVTSNGRELISKTSELHPDVIICDVHMPEMNGVDAVRELKQRMPQLQVIFMSASRSAIPLQEIDQGLAVALICKLDLPRVSRVLAQVIEAASTERPLAA